MDNALFGIRYTTWLDAHPPKGEKPLPYEQWNVFEGYEFDTFEKAKEFAKGETEYSKPRSSYGWSDSTRTPLTQYMAFKLPPEQNYMVREAERIAAGEYELLPEHMRPTGAHYNYVFPRLIEQDGKTMIGWYNSSNEAKYDRLKVVKPTKYFAAFFEESDGWDFMAELGLVSGEVGLIFLTTRDDIRYAYENGPESCMAGKADQYFCEQVHPVEAYASPDLALAVLYRGEDWRENIVARALCNVENKGFVRIYGDIQRMQKMLEAEGYTEDSYCLGGARLLKIFGRDNETGKEIRSVVMTPYLDGSCTSIKLERTGDEYMVIQPRERVFGSSTAGYAGL